MEGVAGTGRWEGRGEGGEFGEGRQQGRGTGRGHRVYFGGTVPLPAFLRNRPTAALVLLLPLLCSLGAWEPT